MFPAVGYMPMPAGFAHADIFMRGRPSHGLAGKAQTYDAFYRKHPPMDVVHRAKIFARIWFPLMYAFLIALTAALWIVGPEFAAGWRRVSLGCFVGGLIVLAASLLTRMRLEYLAAIERLETQGKAA